MTRENYPFGAGGMRKFVDTIVCTAVGTDFPSITIPALQGHYLYSVEIAPGSPAPTDAYVVTIKNDLGVDHLNGQGIGSATLATAFNPGVVLPVVSDLTLAVTGNSESGAKFTIRLHFLPE